MNRHRFILSKHFEFNEASYQQIEKYVIADFEDYCESFVVPSCLDGWADAVERWSPVIDAFLWKIRRGKGLDAYEIGRIQRGKRLAARMNTKN
jgi:hypothetical protein